MWLYVKNIFGSSSRLSGVNQFLDQWESDTLENAVQKLIPGCHLWTDSQSECPDSPQGCLWKRKRERERERERASDGRQMEGNAFSRCNPTLVQLLSCKLPHCSWWTLFFFLFLSYFNVPCLHSICTKQVNTQKDIKICHFPNFSN